MALLYVFEHCYTSSREDEFSQRLPQPASRYILLLHLVTSLMVVSIEHEWPFIAIVLDLKHHMYTGSESAVAVEAGGGDGLTREMLLISMRDAEVSNMIVSFLRLATSAEIDSRAEFFAPFIMVALLLFLRPYLLCFALVLLCIGCRSGCPLYGHKFQCWLLGSLKGSDACATAIPQFGIPLPAKYIIFPS